jgi:hypothetical protein
VYGAAASSVSKQLETAVTSAVQSTVGMGTQPAAAVSIMPGGHDIVAQTSDSDVRVDAGDRTAASRASGDPSATPVKHVRHSLYEPQHTALGASTKRYIPSAAGVRQFIFTFMYFSAHVVCADAALT